MTNNEAIEKINELFNEKMFWDDSIESYNFELTKNFIISALEENTKLKAEIEQLKERLEIKDNNFELYSNALEEIEQLKSEFEQSVKLQNVLSKLLKGSEFARCYMCDNSMKNITLDGKNNGCDGSCYHAKEYTKEDLLNKIKCEIERSNK